MQINKAENLESTEIVQEKNNGKKKWLKRMGAGAFLFFLAKGIVWLFVFAFAAKSCTFF